MMLLCLLLLLLPGFDGLVLNLRGKQSIRRYKWFVQQTTLGDAISDADTNIDSPPIASHNYTINDIDNQVYSLKAIGVVESPYQHKFGTPKQATIAREDGGLQKGILNIKPEFIECLQSLDKFDMLWVITYMHRNSGYKTKIKPQPRKDSNNNSIEIEVGLFSSRAPHRPNPVAISALKIEKIDYNEGKIYVYGLDLLNGTPIIDIKPYVAAFDAFPDAKAGWMDDITNQMDGRVNGYQQIKSSRGARRARSRNRIQQLEESNNINNEETKL